MKKILLFLIIFSFQLSIVDSVSAQTDMKYSFRGKLGESISFRLDLEQNQDGIIAGETTYYRKNGQIAKLPVYGWLMGPDTQCFCKGNAISLTEYDGTKECGHFMIGINDKDRVTEGLWAFGDKSYDMYDVEKTIFPADVTYLHPAKGPAISGEYSFTTPGTDGNVGHGGSCTLAYNNNKVHYQISVNNPNLAETEKTVLLKGCYFSGTHDDYKFKAYVDRNFVVVWTTHKAEVDDWGAWTVLDGIYIRK